MNWMGCVFLEADFLIARQSGLTYQQGIPPCDNCQKCPPHPTVDLTWVREMEERNGTAFYEESLRQLAEYVRRI